MQSTVFGMDQERDRPLLYRVALSIGLSALLAATGLPANPSPPVIERITHRDGSVQVHLFVPAGLRTLTLESKERLGNGAWVPLLVERLDGTEQTLVFHLEVSRSHEWLRVRGDEHDPLPAGFYTGTNQFGGEAVYSSDPAYPTRFEETISTPEDSSDSPDRAVEESDLWQIRGDQLYFFNQLRGLQVLDISRPDEATLLGQLNVPAAGEQMYLLDDRQVLLLVRASCRASGPDQESAVWVVDVASSPPRVQATLPVPGQIVESRRVGTALYVASQTYRPLTDSSGATTWEWGLVLSSFDLSDPAQPVVRDTLWYPGYGNVMAATDRFLFVATQSPRDWRRSIVHVIDIKAPDGTMTAGGTIQLEGRVADKFKLHAHQNVLSVISQVQDTSLYTRLQTFSLADPAEPRPLGRLDLGLSERLHATRFVGDRVYVVTFFVEFRIDPLWVVDLSVPEQPRILGELEVPGFSTYLHPRGDQLLALGIETNQTTVSLFDVADPATPSLLSRVTVGDGWSWSEANWNEKAFQVLDEAGLILVPFQSWSGSGYLRGVQLLDLRAQDLVTRGVIRQEFTPRRATLHRDRILSLSAQEVLSFDASNRDLPRLTGSTLLAWTVDRLVQSGDYLVEIDSGTGGWNQSGKAILRVTPRHQPDAILASLTLDGPPIQGTTRRGDTLFLAQSEAGFYYDPILLEADGSDSQTDPAPSSFRTTAVSLANLPDLTVASQAETDLKSYLGGSWRAVWPDAQTLVWVGGGAFWWRYGGVPETLLAEDRLWAPWWIGNGSTLLAFQAASDESLQFASRLDLGTNRWWNFSRPFAADGKVFLSHQATLFHPELRISGMTVTNLVEDEEVVGVWLTQTFLDVVDYQTPRQPVLRPPVELPGQLQGLSHSGALLYTLGYQYDPATGRTDWQPYLQASAYDGVSVHLVDSLPLTLQWPRPLHVGPEGVAFLGRPGEDSDSKEPTRPAIESWALSASGQWVRLGSLTLSSPATQLDTLPGLLTARLQEQDILMIDAGRPSELHVLGRHRPRACLWADLERADGSATAGLWLPLGPYGVLQVRPDAH